MAETGVVHMDLVSKGGGEAVSMNVLEQDDHDLTLLTVTEPDFDDYAYFNTAVDPVTVRQAGRLAPAIHDRYGNVLFASSAWTADGVRPRALLPR